MHKELYQLNTEIFQSIWESKNRLRALYNGIEDKALAESVALVLDHNDVA